MLHPSNYHILETAPPLPLYNGRLPDVWETIGPADLGLSVNVAEVWRATRKGREVCLQAPSGNTYTYPLAATADWVYAFDLNGRIYYGHTLNNRIIWNFWDVRVQDYTSIEWDVEYAIASLDSLTPRRVPAVDVLVAYAYEGQLWVRYQRERFEIPHKVGKLPPRGRLRTMGLNSENRWVWRFDQKLPDNFNWEIVDGS